MQPYQYQPLPSSSSIRILIFHPAADTSSALECDIITNDRLAFLRGPDNKTFDAVSYVWGNGTHDIPTSCKSEGSYLCISAVVDEILRNLRKSHKERRLWVDAICLNQKDNQEKSTQVQQMGQIYHMADKVHIWLGPAAATTPLAFAFLRTLVAKFEPTPDQAKTPTTEQTLQTFEQTFQHRNFHPVLDLLQKLWFTRRWTLQEGFLARDAVVRCGGSKISWHWFTKGLELIHEISHELQSIKNDQGPLYALNVLKTLQTPKDLLSLLWTLHMSQCSDPRDRIYSLLGLAQRIDSLSPGAKIANMSLTAARLFLPADDTPDDLINSEQELPIPDYALSVDSVYRRFAEDCIFAGRFLEVLLHIDGFGRLSEFNPQWPSWVPNWTTARDRKLNSSTATSRIMPPSVHLDRSRFFSEYRTGGTNITKSLDKFLYPQPTKYSLGAHHGLVVYGQSILKTIRICDAWPGNNDSEHLVKYLREWIHEEAILHLPDQELNVSMMKRAVVECVLLLFTGNMFFGYEKHISFQHRLSFLPNHWFFVNGERMDRTLHTTHSSWIRKCRRIADVLYPIAETSGSYTLEEIQKKEHLDSNYSTNSQFTTEDRQELWDFLDDVSRMMLEGDKRLIVASCDKNPRQLKRHHWIAPNDIRKGDFITDLTHCGRVGALLRPIDFPSELNGRPAFQLIGILWSFHDYSKDKIDYSQSEEFLVL